MGRLIHRTLPAILGVILILSQCLIVWPVSAYSRPKTLKIAVSTENYPFHFVDANGRPAGINVDYWKLWSRKTGIQLEFVPSDWPNTLDNMKAGNADLHAGCFYTKERATYLEYGSPMVEAETHIFTDSAMEPLVQLSDLRPYRIGVMKGDYAESYLRNNLPDASLETFNTYEELLASAQSGRVKVFVADTLTALYQIKKTGKASKFTYSANHPLYTNYFYAAAQKGNQDLIQTVNQGMGMITPAERRSIMSKWTADPKNKTEVTISISTDYPPFSSVDTSGKLSGYLVDLWTLWGEKSKADVHFVANTWEGSLKAVESGQADIHSGLFYTQERSRYMVFGPLIHNLDSRLYFNGSKKGYSHVHQLLGKKVGAVRGSFQEQYLKEKYPYLDVVLFSQSPAMIEAAENGLIDAFMEESITANSIYTAKGMEFPFSDISEAKFSQEMLSALSKHRSDLLPKLQSGFSQITPNEWEQLESKWFSDPRDRIHSRRAPLSLTQEEKDWIAAHPSIMVGCTPDFAPYEFLDSKGYAGISADFMKYLMTAAGLEPVMVYGSWNSLLKDLSTGSGRVDVLFDVQMTPSRADKMLFTSSYLSVPHVAVTATQDAPPKNLKDLRGMRVAVERGFYTVDYLKKDPKIQLLETDNTLNALLAVSSGQADIYIGNEYTTSYYTEKNAIRNLRLSAYADIEPYAPAIAVKKNAPLLRSILNKALAAMPLIDRRNIIDRQISIQPGSNLIFTDAELTWLHDHPQIRSTYLNGWAPISYRNGSKNPVGLAFNLWERIESQLGIRAVHSESLTYTRALETLMNGSSDIFLSAVKSANLSKYMDFTTPYLVSPLVLVTHQNYDSLGTLSALSNQRVGVLQGSYGEDVLNQDYPSLVYTKFDSMDKAYKSLANGEITVLLDCLFNVDYQTRRLDLKTIKVAGVTDYKYEICIGVRKDWPELVRIFNKAIGSLSDSEKKSMAEFWFSQNTDSGVNWSRIIQALVIILSLMALVMIVTVFWNRRLQREIQERRRVEEQLMTAKEAADVASQSKSDFLANMSHEIRTPMNAVIGLASLLGNTGLSERQLDYVDKITRAAHNLLGIINDILDFSKIEAGKMSIETIEFSLETTLRHVVDIINVKAQDKDLELILNKEPNLPDTLYGDPLRLEQILINLANNAVKFTRAGEVEIAVHAVHKSPTTLDLEFMVRDTGIGMNSDQVQEIFSPFTQSDTSTTRKYGGTGLGLSISKNLIEMMGGRIWAQCEPEKGCRFYFELSFPFYGEEGPDYSAFDGTLSDRSVLVVDDNQTAQEVLKTYLAGFHIPTDLVNSGEDALEQIEKKPYDLILMDWKMPGLNGFETAAKIRSFPQIKQPKIIMISAYGQEGLDPDPDLHIDGFLQKPVSESILYNALQKSMLRNLRPSVLAAEGRYKINPHFLEGQRVLLVEDNQMNQQIAQELLKLAGCAVSVVSNGREALQWLSEMHITPGLILMDLQMPEMDGYETTMRIRSDLKLRTPILAMTADAMGGTYEKCMEAGMDDYIAKPIHLEEMMTKLKRWLHLSGEPFMNTLPIQNAKPRETGIFNPDQAISRMGDNESLYLDVLDKFYQGYKDYETQFDEVLQSSERETPIRYFHTLKGTASSIGSPQVSILAENTERILKTEADQNLEPLIRELKETLSSLMENISHWLSNDRPPALFETFMDYTTWHEALVPALHRKKPEEIKLLVRNLDYGSVPTDALDRVDRIVSLCEKYRYKEALKLLQEMSTTP